MVNTKIRFIMFFAAKMEKLCTVSKNKTGTDCRSDHELLIAKFGFKLKKVGKTTRPFRSDLNQILYDYTVEVTNRFKGLNLTDKCLKNYGGRFITAQEAVIKTILKKKQCKKGKMVV